jgi:NADPH:quinone reductase-like Zn-dependent oxidoreductase
LNAVLRLVLRVMSSGIRRRAKRAGVDYSFLFMRADGEQLDRITKLIEDSAIRPVVDRVFPFEQLNDAFAHIDTGRAKGKVVVTMK